MVVVAVHGAAGHHATSWEASSGAGRRPISLFADLVVADQESAFSTVRVLSFGYNTSVWTGASGSLDTAGLKTALSARLGEVDALGPDTSIVFVAHQEGAGIVAGDWGPSSRVFSAVAVLLDPVFDDNQVYAQVGNGVSVSCAAAVVSDGNVCTATLKSLGCPCVLSDAAGDDLPRPTRRASDTYSAITAVIRNILVSK